MTAASRKSRTWGLVGTLALAASILGPTRASIPEDPAVWVGRYNGPDNANEYGASLAVSPNGFTVFATGFSMTPGDGTASIDHDYATVAHSATTGAQLWVARYDGPANADDRATSIGVTPDGSTVFVTGYSDGEGSSYDYATVAYSAATGAQLWVARYNADNRGDRAYSLGVSPDGSTVFVTGYSAKLGSGQDYATVAYSAATGAQLWVARYKGPGNSDDEATSLGVSPDGSTVFVAGTYRSREGYATVAYAAASGAQLWVADYSPENSWPDRANSIGVSPDGSTVFVTGGDRELFGSDDYVTVAYSAGIGAQLWVARYDGPANGSERPYSLGVSPDGSTVFVTGSSTGVAFTYSEPGSTYRTGYAPEYATVAYSASSGAELWVARYAAAGSVGGGAYALGVSPDGSTVFVSGTSWGWGGTYDYATVAYSATTGAQRWVGRYNGPGSFYDVAVSLGVSPDGSRVFVGGTSWGWADSYDYATVSYRASAPCANGHAESGPVSGPVNEGVEPSSFEAAPYVHGVNCEVVAPNRI